MITVGLTGGIGSGKTTVANFFIALGVPVYFADNEAKRLMQSSKVIKRKMIKEFGKNAYADNKLNRSFIANIVFNDTAKLATINAIVHPVVLNSFKRWLGKQKSAYVIQENAILFENNTANNFDKIITVTASLEDKINRVIARDNSTRKDILARISNQISDAEKIENSDFVIVNQHLSKTKKEVAKIHKQLLKIAQQS